MESIVPFNQIMDAFSSPEDGSYYFLLSTGLLKTSAPSKDVILELKEKGVVVLPRRSKEFDKKLKESFVFEIKDPKIAEKVFETVLHENDSGFDALIKELNLSEGYSAHQKKFSYDALLNWLVKSGVGLPGQQLTPAIAISEIDAKGIPDEMTSLVPVSCNKCSNAVGFVVKFFRISPPCDNLLMEAEVRSILSKNGFEEFNFLGKERKEVISASQCPACKGTDLTWDFK
jgi:hypothetical protein